MEHAADGPRLRVRAGFDGVTIAAFVAALAAPALDVLARDAETRGPAPELRVPEPWPEMPADLPGLSAFPARFERHFADTLGLRDVLLSWNSRVRALGFGVAPSANLLIGDDRWVYYRGDWTIEVHRGLAPLRVDELERWHRRLARRAEELARHGTRYVFVVIPNKETVHPERLPAWTRPLGPSRLDQLVAWLRARADVDVLDLRAAFGGEDDAGHDSGPYYNPLGTHWTGRGSMRAYRAIVAHVARDLPSARALADDELEWVEADRGSDTWARSMYMEDALPQRERWARRRGAPGFVVRADEIGPPRRRWTTTPDGRGPRGLFFHDSFGPYVADLLAESFSQLLMDEHVYEPDLVLDERPDVVLEMYVERALVTQAAEDAVSTLEDPIEAFSALPDELHAGAPSTLRPFGGLSVVTAEVAGRRALEFTSHDRRAGLETPPIAMPERGIVRLLVDVDSERECTLDLCWRPAEAQDYARKDRVSILLAAGRARRVVRLHPPSGECRILVHPREEGVRIRLFECSVRAARRAE